METKHLYTVSCVHVAMWVLVPGTYGTIRYSVINVDLDTAKSEFKVFIKYSYIGTYRKNLVKLTKGCLAKI
jgi:hypothetical protein